MKLIEKGNKPKSKVWKPETSEQYFFMYGDGTIGFDNWCNGECKDNRWILGNCFKTKEEAEFALEKRKIEVELQRFAEENNEGEIDWNDGQNKFMIYYTNTYETIDIIGITYVQYAAVYFTSAEIAKHAIKTIGEERLKKYYFEVGE